MSVFASLSIRTRNVLLRRGVRSDRELAVLTLGDMAAWLRSSCGFGPLVAAETLEAVGAVRQDMWQKDKLFDRNSLARAAMVAALRHDAHTQSETWEELAHTAVGQADVVLGLLYGPNAT